MKLLALDTSTEIASIALLSGTELVQEELSSPKMQAPYLLPMIDKLMAKMGMQMNQLDGLVFGRGPGSFTGLRIACSIAKGLAYAHDLALFPVSSLASIAWSVRQQESMQDVPVLAVLDARMHELYWAYFAKEEWEVEEQVNPVQQIVIPNQEGIVLAGVGMDLYQNDFNSAVKSQCSYQKIIYPTAAAMIELVRFLKLKSVPIEQAQPIYVRNKVT